MIQALQKNYSPILRIVKILAVCDNEKIDLVTDTEFSKHVELQLNLRNSVEFNLAFLSQRL